MSNTDMEIMLNEMKVKLEELTNENKKLKNERTRNARKYKDDIQKLNYELYIANKDIDRLVNELDELNSTHKNTIDNRIQELNNEYAKSLEKLKEREAIANDITASTSPNYGKNARGAGRKSIINEELKNSVYALHASGKTQKLIAESCSVSVGTINKILNESIPITRNVSQTKEAAAPITEVQLQI